MATTNKINIIPEVSGFTENNMIFTLTPNNTISVSSNDILKIGHLLQSYLKNATGFPLAVSLNSDSEIKLMLEGDFHNVTEEISDESYSIEVTDKQCLLKSSTKEGLLRAIQTFRQLLPSDIFSSKPNLRQNWSIMGCRIEDSPRFRWRGMHLDVCRHFMPKKDVLRFIDLMALYKFNRFHIHLTEDQGWRIEIKKYPRLTEVGAYRESTLIGHAAEKPKRYDDTPHGGFYTHEDMREIVLFASDRGIEIVPEIDMPGHMQAAISAYPELGCTDQPLKPLCHWGVSQHILNVEDSTIQFMKDVLDEVMDLFPGKYIHVGGDEAPKYQWEESRSIQDRMLELGVKNEEELQSWFIRQMAEHIQTKGRKVIGWDELLEGGLAEGTAVMSWRGEEGGIKAASLGTDVVMTPESFVYFDHYQGDKESEPLAIHGFTTLEKVYNYEVIPLKMPEEQHHHILGSQGQLWTEYMKDFKQVEYMMFPRACALSENLWIKKEKKDYASFSKRLNYHREILGELEVNYKK